MLFQLFSFRPRPQALLNVKLQSSRPRVLGSHYLIPDNIKPWVVVKLRGFTA